MVFLGVLIFAILLEFTPVQGTMRPVKIWRARHWSNQATSPDDAGLKTINKYPANHLKRQSFHTPHVVTDTYGNPVMLPRTDTYGRPFTDAIDVITVLVPYPTSHPPPSTVVTEIATNPQQSRSTQPQALIDTMTYVYIGAGLATLLLVTGALIFLILWAQKRKTRQRVNNTDSC